MRFVTPHCSLRFFKSHILKCSLRTLLWLRFQKLLFERCTQYVRLNDSRIREKKSLFTCLTINSSGSRKLNPNEKALRPLKDNSSRRSKRKVRYGLALALEKNNQQTKNLFGTFWELWVTSEDSQHHEIYDKETLVSAIGRPAGLRLIIWFSGIVGVTVPA